ncbi:hypothetical protein V8C44DRAFT_334425 [Trichoderma aethiopicum]
MRGPGKAVAVRKARLFRCARSPLAPPLFSVSPGFPRDEVVAYHRSVAGACSLHGMAWHGRTWYHISRMSGRGSQAGRKHTQITHSLIHSLTLSLSHSYLSPSPLFPPSSKISFVPFDMKPLFGPPKRNGGNGLLICNRRDSARWGHYLEETRARPARIRRVSRRGRGGRATPGTRSWLLMAAEYEALGFISPWAAVQPEFDTWS